MKPRKPRKSRAAHLLKLSGILHGCIVRVDQRKHASSCSSQLCARG